MRYMLLFICFFISCGVSSGNKNETAPEQILTEAEAYFQKGQYESAHNCYDNYLKKCSSQQRSQIIQKLMESAKQLQVKLDESKGFMGLHLASSKGIDLLRKSLENYPLEDFSDEYAFWVAKYLLEKNRLTEAEIEFEVFLRTYPESPLSADALFYSAETYFKMFRGIDYDITPLINAEVRFQRYLAEFPHSDKAGMAKQRLSTIKELFAQKELKTANYYLGLGMKEAGKLYLQSILNNYPDTSHARQASALLAEINKQK